MRKSSVLQQPSAPQDEIASARAMRKSLEAFHEADTLHLCHPDHFRL